MSMTLPMKNASGINGDRVTMEFRDGWKVG